MTENLRTMGLALLPPFSASRFGLLYIGSPGPFHLPLCDPDSVKIP